MLRAAAFASGCRACTTVHLPRPAEMVTPKDPAHFERILLARRADVPAIH